MSRRRRASKALRRNRRRATARRSGASSSRSCSRHARRRKAAAARASPSGTTFEALATERGLKDNDIDLGIVTKAAMHRPRGRRRRLRAQGGRGQRAGQGPLRHRAGAASVKIEPEQVAAVRGGRRRDQAASSRPSAPGARSPTCTTRSRTSAPAALRSPRSRRSSTSTARTIEAIDRSGRDPDGKPVAGLPTGVDVLASGVRLRRRRRERAAADRRAAATSGSTSPASRRRASARSTRCRTQVEERWRDDEIAERLQGQGDRDASTSSRPARRSAMSRRPTSLNGADRVRPQARRQPGATSAAARDRRGLPRPPKDAAGSAEGKRPDRARRVPGDRHHGAAVRSGLAGGQAHRRQHCAARSPRTCWRSTSRGCRTSSAPPSIRTRCARSPSGSSATRTRCRSSRRPTPSRRAMRAARRRWCGPRWSPTSKRRSRHS